MADPQHGLPAATGNGDDARRSRLLCRRLLKLLLFLVRWVLCLVALYCVKTVFFEDSLSLFDVLQLCVGVVLIAISIPLQCLRIRGVVNNTEADLLFARSRRVIKCARPLLRLLGVLC